MIHACPTCHRRLPGGAQAPADLRREYTCIICGKPHTQPGPGRPRRICTATICQRKAQQRRRIA